MSKRRLQSAALFALSAVMVLAGWFSLGFKVRVGEWATPEPLSALQTRLCFKAAQAAAAELGSDAQGLEAEITPRLMFGGRGEGESELARQLLLSAQGVTELWAVYADGEFVGYTMEPSELYELLESALHERSGGDTVSAGFNASVEIRSLYVPEGTEADAYAAVTAIKEYGVRIITA